MRTEAEIREELADNEAVLKKLRIGNSERKTDYYDGAVKALKWVLSESDEAKGAEKGGGSVWG